MLDCGHHLSTDELELYAEMADESGNHMLALACRVEFDLRRAQEMPQEALAAFERLVA